MYTIRTEDSFAAAHFIKDYNGKCENLHGHNYRVRVYIRGEKLGRGGMLMDFGIVKKLLKKILEDLDHKNLNEIECFSGAEPSAEIIAEYIYKRMEMLLPESDNSCFLSSVEVFETEKNLAVYEKS